MNTDKEIWLLGMDIQVDKDQDNVWVLLEMLQLYFSGEL